MDGGPKFRCLAFLSSLAFQLSELKQVPERMPFSLIQQAR